MHRLNYLGWVTNGPGQVISNPDISLLTNVVETKQCLTMSTQCLF